MARQNFNSRVLPPAEFRVRADPVIQRYDESSGQIFNELTLPATSVDRFWAREAAHKPPKLLSTYRHDGPGSDSLEGMALRRLLQNLGGIDPETFQGVPWSIAFKIWRQIRFLYVLGPRPDDFRVLFQLALYDRASRDIDSFNVWNSFAAVYYRDENRARDIFHYRRQQIAQPGAPLDELLWPLQRLAPQFVTVLCISNVDFSRSQLIGLSKLHNLAVLDIQGRISLHENTFSEVNDGLVRAWSRAAAEAGCFPILRTLILRDHPEITPLSFNYLRRFPALQLYIISSRRGTIMKFKSAAKASGWSHEAGRRHCETLLKPDPNTLAWDDQLRSWAFGSLINPMMHLGAGVSPPTFSLLIGPRHGRDLSWMWQSGDFLSFLRMDTVEHDPRFPAAAPATTTEEEVRPPPKKQRTMRANKAMDFDLILNGYGRPKRGIWYRADGIED